LPRGAMCKLDAIFNFHCFSKVYHPAHIHIPLRIVDEEQWTANDLVRSEERRWLPNTSDCLVNISPLYAAVVIYKMSKFFT
jgi:hypothetical protein